MNSKLVHKVFDQIIIFCLILENAKPKWKPCTCGNKKNRNLSATDKLTDLKLRKIAQALHPEETPRLLTVYVRWKTYRDGSVEYDYETLWKTFLNFGTVLNIIMKSRTSALVVFTTAEAASTAAKVFAKVGTEMKLFVRWLNDMQWSTNFRLNYFS